ncbi:hypothetical protein PybrP1_009838 [[Pythium] brassicae (nom. inval.)]|nr:hypothetical protein PybrP1_009838 [[Pythium] brassicae (nom. inval.)]
MDADDIFDNMSLSDDELLDSLADDMLEEIETTAAMMPMMSQMFGGGASAPPSSAIRGPQLAWDDVRAAAASRAASPSRAYRPSAQPLPNAYLRADTPAASLLDEAVRAAQCEQSPMWRRSHDSLVSQLARSGLAGVFAREFKRQLRERVVGDPDYLAERQAADSGGGRFASIAKALAV